MQRLISVFAFFSVLLGASLLLSGCDSHSAVGSSLRTLFGDAPSPSAVTITLLCDPSAGSPCEPAELTANIDVALAVAASRPGSSVAVWVMGATLAGTRELGRVTSPEASPRGDRAWRASQRAWIVTSRTSLLHVSGAIFADRPRSSPIAEAVSVLSFARRGPNPTIVLVSDGLQVSAETFDFECRRLPEPARFVSRLRQLSLLVPGSLSGTRVIFANDRVTAIDRCPLTMSRLRAVRDLWSAAVQQAGGRVMFSTDAVTTEDLGGAQ